MEQLPAPLRAHARTLLGPGPSDVDPSVLRAISLPTVGHLDPAFLQTMDEIRSMLECLLGARGGRTTALSATGSAGMEACVVNLVERGDRVLIGQSGVFGGRMAEVARRAGAEVTLVEAEWGRPLELEALRRAAAGRQFRFIGLVHGETSTGVLQPLAGLRELADECGALLLVDAVTSLAGHPLDVHASGIDALYSGTQKCLSCPPGLSPVHFSDRAIARIGSRASAVQSWYLDINLIEAYWGGPRAYHHTAPINMLFGLHEALRLVLSEGLEPRFARHELNAHALWSGLEALGLELRVAEEHRLNPLTTVSIPDGIDDAAVRGRLLSEFGIEIGGGLGPMKGNTWRIGLMGSGSSRRNVHLVLSALATVLADMGHRAPENPIAAAASVYDA
ncbi:pyridoxal-phosphate-dependent aminotransferase family protein [Engelhardtia mirabilis]|uniref:Purine catabolism protein PucG n=1 Tax=Engelhardtia mirabilis TaxID=2528011 RepID=A0A518BLH9_9BACT|nr:Purine catabolism protein PucG [Planctomycetes bacterium Pla133]QDV02157.1 Purine catabolism protein PucG [Planctomycetes bacterium Pla86]